jgi:hypothetical protein
MDLIGLWAFVPLNDVILNEFAFFERLVTIALDRGVVAEDIRAVIATQKTVPFCVIEPPDNSSKL